MDYEKLHKDTLQGLQKLVSEGRISEAEAKSICPDFVAESEDERIRKMLLRLCDDWETRTPCRVDTYEVPGVRAWLEKQKEQKPITSKEIDACIYPSPQDWDCQRAYSEGYQKGMLDSNKPAEWSKEDKGVILEAFDKLQSYHQYILADKLKALLVKGCPYCEKGYGCNESPTFSCEDCPKGDYEKTRLWIKTHLPLIERSEDLDDYRRAFRWLEDRKGEKPAEWSKEDECHISNCLNLIENAIKQDKTKYRFYEDYKWLKSLHPQPKQEWSKEDEKMLAFLGSILEYAYDNNPRGFSISCIDVKNWLKSLRPNHWKPSGEQMAILEKIVNVLKTKFTGATVKEQLTLKSLYDDLKKL